MVIGEDVLSALGAGCISFSTYFPTISFSRFTGEPTRRLDSAVTALVCGITET